jgi:hypothetical protein
MDVMPRLIDINEVTGEIHITDIPDDLEEDTSGTT